MEKFTLTIRHILERESFMSARVAAGREGLDREVKWSHVLEVQELDSLINGGELILTTGVGLQLDLTAQLTYVKKLIERKVACLCIEIGPYFEEISQEIIDVANQHAFPIILFEKKVRFVDITQDLHTYIINQHHHMLSQLDALSRKFNALSLTHNGILKILQELHRFFNQSVMFITDQPKLYYYPAESKKWETDIRRKLEQSTGEFAEKKTLTVDDQTFGALPVEGLGQVLGHLCLQRNHSIPEDFTFLLLDRAAIAIAQILLRERTIEERKLNNEDDFVRDLVNGRPVDPKDLQTFLPVQSKNMYYRIFCIQMDPPESDLPHGDWEETKLQRLMSIRTLLKRCGFFPALSCSKTEIHAVACFLADDRVKNEKNRSLHAIEQILEMRSSNYMNGQHCSCGISSVYQDLALAPKAYGEALKAQQMGKKGVVDSPFYEDLGLYKLLLEINDSSFLTSYVESHLAPVLEYDERMDSRLFETLEVYLETNGSKKEAAEQLFIVRQTLYHRLEKLEMLLGKDFMAPSSRLALESAVKAYRLLG
ncbi:PucR family transcriptional regulator [Jeotgalibacillus proteolyticus]|uniref:PucR family transcriptional regulator n=1 Tax=Jeotgalibacillus proteolyticus TaxID=2082395 RepID=A0A2S5GBF9_9BACL|nr:PucR family transcriptional regulator [Jeotgalibacillus proteolyticus]PPA70336.1 PucR family transcriptional regulator [Jeotgalibacillus proteolyticus]